MTIERDEYWECENCGERSTKLVSVSRNLVGNPLLSANLEIPEEAAEDWRIFVDEDTSLLGSMWNQGKRLRHFCGETCRDVWLEQRKGIPEYEELKRQRRLNACSAEMYKRLAEVKTLLGNLAALDNDKFLPVDLVLIGHTADLLLEDVERILGRVDDEG